LLSLAALSLPVAIFAAGCNGISRTTGTTLVGTGVGAGVGAIAGGSKGTAIGAGAGALSGFLVGVYEDKREEKMRREEYERQRDLDYAQYERAPAYDPEYEEFLRWKRQHETVDYREP
jgi:uncharacterized protein YcfJ